MSQRDPVASNGEKNGKWHDDEIRNNNRENHEPQPNDARPAGADGFPPPRGNGPTRAPWVLPQPCFEPSHFSPDVTLTPMDQIEPIPPAWECCGHLRRGAVTIVAGEHGSGKSLLAMDWAARITRGEPGLPQLAGTTNRAPRPSGVSARQPDDSDGGPGALARPTHDSCADAGPGEVVVAHACDMPLDLLRRRLEAAGGQPNRIGSLALAFPDSTGEFALETIRRRLFSLTSAMHGTTNVRLLVIDNLEAWAGNYHESPNAALLGLMLAQLTELAARTNIAILALAHLPHAGGQAAARKLDHLMSLAPIVYLAASDPDRPCRKLLLPLKNNLARPSGASFETIDGRLVWSEAPVDATADEFIAPLSKRLEARHERESVARWILAALAAGPVESSELLREARHCGISLRTFRRAARSLGLSPHKTSFDGPWQWRLGGPAAPAAKDAPAADGGPGVDGKPGADGGPGAPARPTHDSRDNAEPNSNSAGRGRPALPSSAGRGRPAQECQPRSAALGGEDQVPPVASRNGRPRRIAW